MKRVVLDTNVVVSACLWRGPSSRCLEAWSQGGFLALVSPPMLAEYADVLERLRQRYPDKPWVDWVSALRDAAELVFPALQIPDAFADPDDAIFAECAVAGEADFLVSGDKAHVQAAAAVRGIPILSPARFLEIIGSERT
ncbi:MAG: putative toxin-antitoxin system toxin component, PIN family [Verrucomicrobiales bacterium]|nr:putative toxin-antitoxin system toxin component, PIN family [Verrucomicrobiales bacterium]